jgi:GT2 family glycosyltransferase
MKALGPEDVASLNGTTIGFPSGLGIFIRSDRWREAGGYDEAFAYGGDDSDLGIKMWLLGYRNYLFSESYAIHIGDEKRVTIDMYCFKLKNFTSAGFYTILKNYSSLNLAPALLAFCLKSIMKMIKQSLRWRSMKPVFATLAGYGHFLAISSAAFDLRRLIQARRKMRRDIFLFKPPVPNRNRS